jgi:hypothetical protein
MKTLTLLLCLACVAVMAQQPASTQPTQSPGDSVRNVKQVSGRIFLSTDQGVTWKQMDKGFPPDESINAWVEKDQTIIAGTETHGIFISSHQLKSWHPSNKGLPAQVRIISLATHKQFLFAGSYRHGLFYSDDLGETWTAANRGLNNLTVRCLYSYNSILFAGTDSGLYLSFDDGKSWDLSVPGAQFNSFSSLNRQLYVATNQGVLTSRDGQKWDWIYSEGAIYSLAARGEEIYLLDFFGNVYRSLARNLVWLKADLYLPFRYTFQLTPQGRKFFTIEWKNAIRSLNNIETFQSDGFPPGTLIMELLNTSRGLLAGVALPSGC